MTGAFVLLMRRNTSVCRLGAAVTITLILACADVALAIGILF